MQYCSQAIDKNTGYFGTCTWADKELAYRAAQYYRSVGYRAKVFTEDEYDVVADQNARMRREQMRNQKGARCYEQEPF